MLLVNTFDVEPWWATVPPCVDPLKWDDMPDRGNAGIENYLDLCDLAHVKCTFFFVGWYANKFPCRVRAVLARGHEVGCHSLIHGDVAKMTGSEFRNDTLLAKKMIEDAGGSQVISYRAPSFSFPPNRYKELVETLASLGFLIDSSVTTAGRIYGGGYDGSIFYKPFNTNALFGVDILEIPAPGVNFLGKEYQFFGGGYFRLAPLWLLRHLARRESYQLLYLHPHDFDQSLPPLPGGGYLSNLRRTIKIGDVNEKLISLLKTQNVKSCRQIYDEQGVLNAPL
jgi:polysaccharide deacetylase family protein (PEP-CTERM system associated)